jgi:integrase
MTRNRRALSPAALSGKTTLALLWASQFGKTRSLFSRIGARAEMPFPVHPHMLRHGCGYAGHDTRALQAYLGHKNIQRTPERFKNFQRD